MQHRTYSQQQTRHVECICIYLYVFISSCCCCLFAFVYYMRIVVCAQPKLLTFRSPLVACHANICRHSECCLLLFRCLSLFIRFCCNIFCLQHCNSYCNGDCWQFMFLFLFLPCFVFLCYLLVVVLFICSVIFMHLQYRSVSHYKC